MKYGHESILLSAVVCAAGVALPLMLHLPTNSKLYEGIATSATSAIFIDTILIAISLFVPMIIDAIIDYRLPTHLTIPRAMLLFAQIVPNTILYTNAFVRYYNRAAVFFSVMHLREVLMFGAMLGYYVGATTQFDKTALSLIMMIVFGLAMNVHNASIYLTHNAALVEHIGVAVSGFSVLGVIVLCVYRLIRWLNHIDVYEPYTAIYVYCLLFSHLIKWSIYISMGAGFIYPRVGFYYALIPLVDGAVAVVAATLPGRMAREELLQAQGMLETKRNFVRHISHELRTPLNTVYMGIQLATQEIASIPNSEEVLDIMDSVHTSCNVSIEILNDMLLFDRLHHQGDVEMHFQAADMCQLVESISKTFVIQAMQSNINYNWHNSMSNTTRANRGAIVRMDVHKMSQVIRNLISNALKFTPAGGSVTVTMRRIDTMFAAPIAAGSLDDQEKLEVSNPLLEAVPKVRIEVEDTGPGISQEEKKKLFHSIVQFHAAELQGGKGSGLGLWISKHIMDAHGGIINVISEGADKGSIFYIELPLYSDAQDIETSSHDAEQEDQYLIPDKRNEHHRRFSPKSHNDAVQLEVMRVLIVEDSAFNRKMLHAALESVFNEIYEASNGLEALDCVQSQKLARHPIDVIFLDNIMPQMSGVECCRQLRSMQIGYSGKIIGVTGNVLGSAVIEFISAGADIVLHKPLLLDDIFHSLGTVLPEHKQIFDEAAT